MSEVEKALDKIRDAINEAVRDLHRGEYKRVLEQLEEEISVRTDCVNMEMEEQGEEDED